MKYLIFALALGFITAPAFAKPAREMSDEEYRAYINARNNDPAWHEQLKERAERYKAEHHLTDEEAAYQEQENPNDPRLDSEDFRNYLQEKADELDKSE